MFFTSIGLEPAGKCWNHPEHLRRTSTGFLLWTMMPQRLDTELDVEEDGVQSVLKPGTKTAFCPTSYPTMAAKSWDSGLVDLCWWSEKDRRCITIYYICGCVKTLWRTFSLQTDHLWEKRWEGSWDADLMVPSIGTQKLFGVPVVYIVRNAQKLEFQPRNLAELQ